MQPTTKWTIAAVSVVALLGVGLAAAQTSAGQQATSGMRAHFAALHGGGGAGGHEPWALIHELCDDNITVGECKRLVHEAVHGAVQERYGECLESHSQDYCDGRLDQFKAQHPHYEDATTA